MIFDKVSNYKNFTPEVARNYTKKVMVFLEDQNLLNENGLEALEEWGNHSQIEDSMLTSEGTQLLRTYYNIWNENFNFIHTTQEETNEYWNRRLHDIRTYNRACVKNESSFPTSTDNFETNKKGLEVFFECVDNNISKNADYLLFECHHIGSTIRVKCKTYDKDIVLIDNDRLNVLTEGYILVDLNDPIYESGTLYNEMKNTWNSVPRQFKGKVRLQPSSNIQRFREI